MSNKSHVYSLIALWLFLIHQSCTLYSHGWSFIQNVNLIFHEAGHSLFVWSGKFIYTLMGSGLEILIPASLSWYFYQDRQAVAAYFCLWWTGTTWWSTGIYAGDALSRKLPLLGGDAVSHDWYYLLLETKLLYHADTVGRLFYMVGTVCIITALSVLAFTIYTKIYSL